MDSIQLISYSSSNGPASISQSCRSVGQQQEQHTTGIY